jgi:hypothetical protein
MDEGNAAKTLREPTIALPCGKEIPQVDSKEFARRIYLQTLKFSLQLNRKDRWKIIHIMTDTDFTAGKMCRTVFGSQLFFHGKKLCQLVCPLVR